MGIGIGLYIEPNGFAFSEAGFSNEAATVRDRADGHGDGCPWAVPSHGQGLETTVPQVAADSLGVHVDDVDPRRKAIPPRCPSAVAPGGVAALCFCRGAVHEACARAPAEGRRDRRPRDGGSPRRTSHVENGIVAVRGTPTRSITVAEVARLAYLGPGPLAARRRTGARIRRSSPAILADHTVELVSHGHLRGRPAHRHEPVCSATRSARTAAS